MMAAVETETLGLVASGHPETSAAAAEVLRAGGNAFDAAVAAGFAAAVVEPCLTSLAGGGFLQARTAAGEEVLFDFFVAVPGLGAARPHDPVALVPVPIHFDAAVQVFHVGPASVATPGVLAGYRHVHERLGRLPLATVVAPAVRLARDGVVVNRFFAQLVRLLEPVLLLDDAGRGLFTDGSRPLREGDHFRNPALAGFLHEIGAGAVTGFDASDLGGEVTAADLASYRVVERAPLRVPYRRAEVLTNPLPSFGGTLVAHALDALAAAGPPAGRHDPAQVCAVAEALIAQADRRAELGRGATRGTTHLSVCDAAGNVAAMTTSNGSCSGVFAGDTGVQLNNVMGEEDLHPAGFGALAPGTRIGSMMAPTIVVRPGHGPAAFGSGGSERIRSTIAQLVVDLVDHELSLAGSVAEPRLHWDGERLQVEPGFGAEAVAALWRRWEVNEWTVRDLYFGGAHGVQWPGEAVGDPRRGGCGMVVTAD
jgi:gamma-glutamyltranspeptidase/glutathione hydrolase